MEKLVDREVLFTTTITQYELLVGAYLYGERELKFVKRILAALQIVEVEEHIPLAAKIMARLLKMGKPINDLDVMIAATCIAHNLTLLTKDQDFKILQKIVPLDIKFV